jgi:hypothetical protein
MQNRFSPWIKGPRGKVWRKKTEGRKSRETVQLNYNRLIYVNEVDSSTLYFAILEDIHYITASKLKFTEYFYFCNQYSMGKHLQRREVSSYEYLSCTQCTLYVAISLSCNLKISTLSLLQHFVQIVSFASPFYLRWTKTLSLEWIHRARSGFRRGFLGCFSDFLCSVPSHLLPVHSTTHVFTIRLFCYPSFLLCYDKSFYDPYP